MTSTSHPMRKRHRLRQDGRSAGGEQYLRLSYDMAHSLAWRSLSGNAVKVWVELRCRYNGKNNGKLCIPYASACKLLGIGRATMKRVLDELQSKGFIRLVKQGHWYGRQAAEWQVTDNMHDGHLARNDWKHWQPEQKKLEVGFNAEHI
jgi:hypothetical protein